MGLLQGKPRGYLYSDHIDSFPQRCVRRESEGNVYLVMKSNEVMRKEFELYFRSDCDTFIAAQDHQYALVIDIGGETFNSDGIMDSYAIRNIIIASSNC